MNNYGGQLEIIPAVNIYKGTLVIRGKNGYEPFKDEEGEAFKTQELIDDLKEEGYKRIYIADINGINRDRPELDMIKNLSTKIELWVDGGSRYADSSIDILIAGAEKVVLSTKTLKNIKELERAFELSHNIIFSIDYDDNIVSPKKEIREMSPVRLMEEAQKLGIKDIIFCDLKHLSSDTNFNLEVGKTLLGSQMNIYFYGNFKHVSSMYNQMDISGLIIEVNGLI